MTPIGRENRSLRSAADQTAVDYLLGELPDPDQAAFERRLLESGQVFEQVSIVEDELIDEYLQRELSGPERERFEREYLASPTHRERLDFARALKAQLAHRKSALTPQTEARRSFLGGRAAALRVSLAFALVLAVAGLFLGLQSLRSRRELERVVAEAADLRRQETELRRQVADLRAHNDRLTQEAERARIQASKANPAPRHPEAIVASLALTATLVRDSSATQTLNLRKEVTEVALTLSTREDLPGPFRAILRTVQGSIVWKTRDSSPPRAEKSPGNVTVRIPASRLSSDDYILTLSSVGRGDQTQDGAAYYFRVKRN